MSYVNNAQAADADFLSLQFLLFLLQIAMDQYALRSNRQLNHSTFKHYAVHIYKHFLECEIRHQWRPSESNKHWCRLRRRGFGTCENYISTKSGQILLNTNSSQELAFNFPLGEILDNVLALLNCLRREQFHSYKMPTWCSCCSTLCNLPEGPKSHDISWPHYEMSCFAQDGHAMAREMIAFIMKCAASLLQNRN